MVTKTKDDRFFILILALVAANLSYWLIKTMLTITDNWWSSTWLWLLAMADVIAIIGILWLIGNYRKRRRLEKEAQTNPSSEESSREEA